MARCGCVDNSCTCSVRPGGGLLFSGEGSQSQPLVLSVGGSATHLAPVSTAYMTVTVTGDGSTATPYSIKVDKTALTPPDRPLRVAEFLTPGAHTWVRPSGVTVVQVIAVGGGDGGGGGGGGSPGAYTAAGAGGAGGRGGRWHQVTLPLDVGCTGATVTVGAGGASTPGRGAGPTANQVQVGNSGQSSSVEWIGWTGTKIVATQSNSAPLGVTAGYERTNDAGSGGNGASYTGGTLLTFPRTLGLLHPWTPDSVNRLSGKGGDGGTSAVDPDGGPPRVGVDGQFPGGGAGGGGAGFHSGGGYAGGKGGDGAVWIVML